MLRFDCSELSGPESKNRLIGMPAGYISSEQGGQNSPGPSWPIRAA